MDNRTVGIRSASFVLAFAAGFSAATPIALAQRIDRAAASRAGVAQGTAVCSGDCNADQVIRVNELVTATNIATGSAPLEACASVDANTDLRVTVDELVGAVGRALHGCPDTTVTVTPTTSAPLATATATPSLPPTVTGTVSVIPTATAGNATGTPAGPTATPDEEATATVPSGNTPTPTATVEGTVPTAASGTATPTATSTATDEINLTPTRSGSMTRTRTPSRTRTGTRTPTATRTGTETRTPRPPTRTPSATITRTFSPTRSPSPSRTPTRTGTGTATPRASNTPTATRPPRITATVVGTPGAGPRITYFGIARADGFALNPSSFDNEGRPIFLRQHGHGAIMVVEAKPGTSNRLVGDSAFDDSGGFPDLQLLLSDALGNGNPAICDVMPPNIGGVVGIPALSFDPIPSVINAVNDLGCRVDDGLGNNLGRRASGDACTRSDASSSFGYGFVDPTSTIQFCIPIADAWRFRIGDTTVAGRLRDTFGNIGAVKEIVVRITQ